MKSGLYAFLLLIISSSAFGQSTGKVISQSFTAISIKENIGGEDAVRSLTVYLPPGYDDTHDAFPVIYFLHGFSLNDSLMFEWLGFKNLMDEAIRSGKIKPVILVLPGSDTRFKGSFYTNSALTGNWADYIGKDVVQYVDKNFRTIPDRRSRGISGHSMGGNGALKLAMLFPDVFGALYALSPAVLNWSNEYNINNRAFRKISLAKSESDIFKDFDQPENTDEISFYTMVMVSQGRTYSPNSKSLFQADFPVTYRNDSMKVNNEVLKRWEANFPFNMIDDHVQALKSYQAIKMDWGRNENFDHIPATCLQFSKKLEAYKIQHFAEEYIGDHVNKLDGRDGRIYTEMLPFFDTYLNFSDASVEIKQGKKTSRKK